jgi:hypothetical protein
MKPISTSLFANNTLFASALLLVLLVTTPRAVPAVEDLGAHRVGNMEEFQRVIDIRCTVCHTRERVDDAIKKRAALEKLEERMVDKGAVLTERDKNVLGTFWGSPLKQRTPEHPDRGTENLK